jgi:hypothetical protein
VPPADGARGPAVSIIPSTALRIGTWRRNAETDPARRWDLVTYSCAARGCLSWFVRDGAHAFRMDVRYSALRGMKLEHPGPGLGIAFFELAAPPAFFMEGAARAWTPCADWTAHQAATTTRVHELHGSAAQLMYLLRETRRRMNTPEPWLHAPEPERKPSAAHLAAAAASDNTGAPDALPTAPAQVSSYTPPRASTYASSIKSTYSDSMVSVYAPSLASTYPESITSTQESSVENATAVYGKPAAPQPCDYAAPYERIAAPTPRTPMYPPIHSTLSAPSYGNLAASALAPPFYSAAGTGSAGSFHSTGHVPSYGLAPVAEASGQQPASATSMDWSHESALPSPISMDADTSYPAYGYPAGGKQTRVSAPVEATTAPPAQSPSVTAGFMRTPLSTYAEEPTSPATSAGYYYEQHTSSEPYALSAAPYQYGTQPHDASALAPAPAQTFMRAHPYALATPHPMEHSTQPDPTASGEAAPDVAYAASGMGGHGAHLTAKDDAAAYHVAPAASLYGIHGHAGAPAASPWASMPYGVWPG